MELIPKRQYIHIVIPDRKLVYPRLQGVFVVSVDNHILREILEMQPLVHRRFQRPHRIFFQDILPEMDLPFQFAGIPFRRMSLRDDKKGNGEKKQSDRKQRGRPIFFQEYTRRSQPACGYGNNFLHSIYFFNSLWENYL